MIKAGLVTENATIIIIIFLSQIVVNINLRDKKSLKINKEKINVH